MTQLSPVDHLLPKIEKDLASYIQDHHLTKPAMIGIHTGGVWVAEHLHQALAIEPPLGHLNITFYRDDYSQKGLHPRVKPSTLPFDIEGRHIILVDDVIMSGRTVRAALNELFDYGRPASVTLVALVDLQSRELPIQADVVGQSLKLAANERIKLSGPEPLTMTIQRLEENGTLN